MFRLLPEASKLKREKSCLLIRFAVCDGEALCLYSGHKQGAENAFLHRSVVRQFRQVPAIFPVC